MTTVPLLFSVEELVDHFHAAGEPAAAELDEALGRVGRNHGPALLVDLWSEGLLTAEAAMRAVPSTWCGCEFPSRTVDADLWRALFDLAGYTVEGISAERPTRSLRLYRGAVPKHRDGWSWTDDRQLAEWFAQRAHKPEKVACGRRLSSPAGCSQGSARNARGSPSTSLTPAGWRSNTAADSTLTAGTGSSSGVRQRSGSSLPCAHCALTRGGTTHDTAERDDTEQSR